MTSVAVVETGPYFQGGRCVAVCPDAAEAVALVMTSWEHPEQWEPADPPNGEFAAWLNDTQSAWMTVKVMDVLVCKRMGEGSQNAQSN